MCTVTVVRNGGETIITSNRDEHISRPSAIAPQEYQINGKTITFPKDPFGGGTWFAVDEFGNAVVLLNGARQRSKMNPSYRKSRGLIVLDIISSDSLIDAWKQLDLTDIAPFTLIVLENDQLFDLRWNGFSKEASLLNEDSGIWSSSTLYSDHIRSSRELWFDALLQSKGGSINADELLH